MDGLSPGNIGILSNSISSLEYDIVKGLCTHCKEIRDRRPDFNSKTFLLEKLHELVGPERTAVIIKKMQSKQMRSVSPHSTKPLTAAQPFNAGASCSTCVVLPPSLAGAPLEGASSSAPSCNTTEWQRPGKCLHPGVVLHSISRTGLALHEISKEQSEFQKAAFQFFSFTRYSIECVVRVEAVEYGPDSEVRCNYEACREALKAKGVSTTEVLVFHGTPRTDTVMQIMVEGFKVGGVDPGLKLTNGNAFGNGVYTATGASTPVGYARGSNAIILAKGLQGVVGAVNDVSADSVKVQPDWIIFRSGRQLLPLYVVYFSLDRNQPPAGLLHRYSAASGTARHYPLVKPTVSLQHPWLLVPAPIATAPLPRPIPRAPTRIAAGQSMADKHPRAASGHEARGHTVDLTGSNSIHGPGSFACSPSICSCAPVREVATTSTRRKPTKKRPSVQFIPNRTANEDDAHVDKRRHVTLSRIGGIDKSADADDNIFISCRGGGAKDAVAPMQVIDTIPCRNRPVSASSNLFVIDISGDDDE